MPGEMIWPRQTSTPNLSNRGRREVQRSLEQYKIGELQAFLDRQSAMRFINDAGTVVNHARRVAGNDQALLGLLAPIIENWMNREHTTLEYRNINRMMGY